MVIVGAAMHKLLSLAYGVLKSAVPFNPNYSSQNLWLSQDGIGRSSNLRIVNRSTGTG